MIPILGNNIINWARDFGFCRSLELEGNHLLVGESEDDDRGRKICSIHDSIFGG